LLKHIILYYHVLLLLLCFFFSSRRRHTISKRDWSSDVCSSDLKNNNNVAKSAKNGDKITILGEVKGDSHQGSTKWYKINHKNDKIGRASCRERVKISAVAGEVKKTKKYKKRLDVGKRKYKEINK